MDLFQPIDIYCERMDAGYWAEPINALTNFAFVIAGFYGLWLARREDGDFWPTVFALWVCAIGIGSFLFHTHANGLAALADVIPIWTFFLLYVGFAFRRYLQLSWRGVVLGFAIGAVLIAGLSAIIPEEAQEATNGSIQYLPVIVALLFFAAVLFVRRAPAAPYILTASLVFAVSIFFRSIDESVCDIFVIGTHFLWHCLNGVMLAVLLRAAVYCGGPRMIGRPE